MKIGPPQLNGDFAVGFYSFRPTLPETAFPQWEIWHAQMAKRMENLTQKAPRFRVKDKGRGHR